MVKCLRFVLFGWSRLSTLPLKSTILMSGMTGVHHHLAVKDPARGGHRRGSCQRQSAALASPGHFVALAAPSRSWRVLRSPSSPSLRFSGPVPAAGHHPWGSIGVQFIRIRLRVTSHGTNSSIRGRDMTTDVHFKILGGNRIISEIRRDRVGAGGNSTVGSARANSGAPGCEVNPAADAVDTKDTPFGQIFSPGSVDQGQIYGALLPVERHRALSVFQKEAIQTRKIIFTGTRLPRRAGECPQK